MWGVTLLAVLAALPGSVDAAPPGRRPNIVLIVADDLGYAELGCQGATDVRTPHIDSIAHHGIRFISGYVTAPVCSPSRAGLLTGRYQQRFGHELNAIGPQNRLPHVGLPTSEKTIADDFRAAGYATGIVGKWHLGGTEPYHPERRGFGEFFGFLHEGHFYVEGRHNGVVSRLRPDEPPYDDQNPVLRGTQPVGDFGYLTGAFTREAVAFIDRHRDRPFFLYLPYNAVHSPMQATEADLGRFPEIKDRKRRIFAAMLGALDEGVGAVLGKLREAGLTEDTLIVFLSDNGGPTAELTSSNAPLRGGKGELYEGGVRVPFLMQWEGHVPGGVVDARPVSSLCCRRPWPSPRSSRMVGSSTAWTCCRISGAGTIARRTSGCSGGTGARRPCGRGGGSWCGTAVRSPGSFTTWRRTSANRTTREPESPRWSAV